jgi:hypothetical protein
VKTRAIADPFNSAGHRTYPACDEFKFAPVIPKVTLSYISVWNAATQYEMLKLSI